ncbi:MAG: DUF393 domain-containing protein [Deltaproteobacteria bacterium]|nr:MAG: DUF393 domain-containing protein [Deltaproteobacteria bacterium]
MKVVMEDSEKQATLFYDSECGLCLRFKQALDRIPGTSQINKISIHEAEAFSNFPELTKQQCEKEVHLVDENGNILVGEEVIEYLISKFPGVEKFAWLLESGMGQKAVEYFNTIAKLTRETLRKRCSTCKN